jgi:hypothetical protein
MALLSHILSFDSNLDMAPLSHISSLLKPIKRLPIVVLAQYFSHVLIIIVLVLSPIPVLPQKDGRELELAPHLIRGSGSNPVILDERTQPGITLPFRKELAPGLSRGGIKGDFPFYLRSCPS